MAAAAVRLMFRVDCFDTLMLSYAAMLLLLTPCCHSLLMPCHYFCRQRHYLMLILLYMLRYARIWRGALRAADGVKICWRARDAT